MTLRGWARPPYRPKRTRTPQAPYGGIHPPPFHRKPRLRAFRNRVELRLRKDGTAGGRGRQGHGSVMPPFILPCPASVMAASTPPPATVPPDQQPISPPPFPPCPRPLGRPPLSGLFARQGHCAASAVVICFSPLRRDWRHCGGRPAVGGNPFRGRSRRPPTPWAKRGGSKKSASTDEVLF